MWLILAQRFKDTRRLLRRLQARLQRVNRPRLPVGLRLVFGLLTLIAAATFLLSLPGVAVDGRLTFSEALFTAVSALTVTGLTLISPALDLTLAGQILLMVLIQIGGVGFMVGVVMILRLMGRRITYLDQVALTDHFGLLKRGAVLNLTWSMLRITLLIEALGAVLLWFAWQPRLGAERAVLYALFHAVSAFCNAGFDLFSGLVDYPGGLPNDPLSLLILGALVFTGGLGVPILVELRNWKPGVRFSLHTRITLVVVISLLVLGAVGFYLGERERLLAGQPLSFSLPVALFQSISARTAGFAGISAFEDLAPSTQLLMMALMFIGSAPVSMGGGITTGAFATLGLGVWTYVRGHAQVVLGGRSIAEYTVRRAASVVVVSLLVVVTSTWLILITHPVELDQALFEVISAFATCGLTLAFTGELNHFGQAVLMLVMFWGRLGPLTVVFALSGMGGPRRVRYPEEQILIG